MGKGGIKKKKLSIKTIKIRILDAFFHFSIQNTMCLDLRFQSPLLRVGDLLSESIASQSQHSFHSPEEHHRLTVHLGFVEPFFVVVEKVPALSRRLKQCHFRGNQ